LEAKHAEQPNVALNQGQSKSETERVLPSRIAISEPQEQFCFSAQGIFGDVYPASERLHALAKCSIIEIIGCGPHHDHQNEIGAWVQDSLPIDDMQQEMPLIEPQVSRLKNAEKEKLGAQVNCLSDGDDLVTPDNYSKQKLCFEDDVLSYWKHDLLDLNDIHQSEPLADDRPSGRSLARPSSEETEGSLSESEVALLTNLVIAQLLEELDRDGRAALNGAGRPFQTTPKAPSSTSTDASRVDFILKAIEAQQAAQLDQVVCIQSRRLAPQVADALSLSVKKADGAIFTFL
jgi:hypothetical protein